MKDYLNEINDKFPVRRSPEEKKAFFEYVKNEAESVGINARVETLKNKHNNIVIGDVENAKVVYTAHYDTPARSLIPNLMMPRSPVMAYAYGIGVPILIAMLSLQIAGIIAAVAGLEYRMYMLLYLLIYFGAFFGIYRCGTNKHNKNDNTSGVATVLSIMAQKPENVAFILFDNEEKGLLGSKTLLKSNKELWQNKLLVNFDCVGLGENIVIIAMENAEKHEHFPHLTETVTSENGYNVGFFPKKGSMTNTDSKNFPCGISVMACKKSKKGIYYTPNIHTVKDTEAYSENIYFLSEKFSEFSRRISEAEI